MARGYIELLSSNAAIGGRFRVIFGGYDVSLSKSQTIQKTIGGSFDVTAGAIYETHQYIIKVRETEPEANFANRAALEQLYRLNNPSGTPTNIITFRDHFYDPAHPEYGHSYTCYMTGDLKAQTLGCEIVGNTAWFLIQVVLQIIPS